MATPEPSSGKKTPSSGSPAANRSATATKAVGSTGATAAVVATGGVVGGGVVGGGVVGGGATVLGIVRLIGWVVEDGGGRVVDGSDTWSVNPRVDSASVTSTA